MTHITRIRGIFDVAILRWTRSNVISMVPFTHAAFFIAKNCAIKKGSTVKKSHCKKIVANLPYVCHGTKQKMFDHLWFWMGKGVEVRRGWEQCGGPWREWRDEVGIGRGRE